MTLARHRHRLGWWSLHDHLHVGPSAAPVTVNQKSDRRHGGYHQFGDGGAVTEPRLRPPGIGGDFSQCAYGVGMDISIRVSNEASYTTGDDLALGVPGEPRPAARRGLLRLRRERPLGVRGLHPRHRFLKAPLSEVQRPASLDRLSVALLALLQRLAK
jgi:hypothetical protein